MQNGSCEKKLWNAAGNFNGENFNNENYGEFCANSLQINSPELLL